jgi:hypothetical protein
VQRAAGGEQRAAGGWRGASSRAGQQSGVGGGPERPNKFQKFLASQISEFIVVPRFCATECWYKICTMFLVPDRVIFAGQEVNQELLLYANSRPDLKFTVSGQFHMKI